MLLTEIDKAKLYTDAFNAGHEQGKADAFKEFVELYREFCLIPHDEEACLKSDEECDGMCIDCFEKWVQKKEQK